MNERGTLRCGAYLGNIDAVLDAIAGYSLDILAYENDNRDTGFVAYAFGSGDREVIAAMRGSERAGECAPTNVDWRDNFWRAAGRIGAVRGSRALFGSLPRRIALSHRAFQRRECGFMGPEPGAESPGARGGF